MLALPNMVRVSSSGPAGELYPDSLGDYYKLTIDVTLNDLPVYQHSARDDRYIIGNGNFNNQNSLVYSILISNSKFREAERLPWLCLSFQAFMFLMAFSCCTVN